jgi:glucose-1-phosphate cytidylyltransferase
MLTYGDGVCNIDIPKLLEFHRTCGKHATVTAVRPPSRFGNISFENDLVVRFEEKTQMGAGWINGGFFVLEPEIASYIEGDHTLWEQHPMKQLAAEGQLAAYQHQGFWQCMDTLRDVQYLNELWNSGEAPWRTED